MKILNSLLQKYQVLAIKFNPERILRIKQPSHKFLCVALDKNPELFLKLKEPGVEIVRHILWGHPDLITLHPSITDETKVKLVSTYPYAIQYIQSPSLKMYEVSIVREPRLLERLVLDDKIKETIYYKYPQFFSLIPCPSEHLQLNAVKDRWTNIFLIDKPSESIIQTFSSRYLGIKTISPTPSYTSAVVEMLNEWKDIEHTYQTTQSYSGGMIPIINAGYESYPEELREEIYYQRYKASVLKFRAATHQKIDITVVPAIDNDIYKENIRISALTEGNEENIPQKFSTDQELEDLCKHNAFSKAKLNDDRLSPSSTLINPHERKQLEETLTRVGKKIQDIKPREIFDLMNGKCVPINVDCSLQRVKSINGYNYKIIHLKEVTTSLNQCIL